ncbi:heterokaryon incompatibility protein-domain-containing protein [Dactylonectria macrodidyma]|uniref:Heterokaryon incompatibility protein-domain-containing protein n=1 Tax=Dactylonectria macrodidyma TaxID=307937 RepID=A0A9P9DM35_9HYPO|nr:heterokaryon incompatibility protein-domain-containing protein [Dactylonectria macrodidyma]
MKTRTKTQRRSSTSHKKTPRKALAFQYQPLDPAKRQIRLLELSPGKPGSRVSARLIHVSLNGNPRYDALSYMWGPPRPSYTVSIEGCPFTVGRNLRKALDDLRWPDKPRIVWTDAICINQTDTKEKETQIQLMRAIYAGANTVCAWIDHSVRPINSVFEDLENLGKGVTIGDFVEPSHWYPVAEIFRNPYWRRLWVQQELVLATQITVYCRRDSFDAQQLLEFQRQVNVVKHQVVNLLSPASHLSRYMSNAPTDKAASQPDFLSGDILRARENLALGREAQKEQTDKLSITRRVLGSSLLQLFIKTAGLNYTDPKDRVYGILGLAVDVDETVFNVDYSLSVVGVYTKVFQQFVDKYKNLGFICFGKYYQSVTPSTAGLPTWMPHENIDWGPLNASRACGALEANRVSIQPDTLVLTAEGLLLDKISFVADEGQLTELPVVDLLAKVEEYCKKVGISHTKCPLYEREEITSLLFPSVAKSRYKQLYQLEKPTPDERVELIRSLRTAASNADDPTFSLRRLIQGGYTPIDLMPAQAREALMPMFVETGSLSLVGTEGGRLGSVKRKCPAKAGDQIWILFGCRLPMILRPEAGNPGRCTVVGYMILPGVMRGEAVEGLLSSEDAATIRGTKVELI